MEVGLLTTEQAATHLNISPRTLEKKRRTGDGPPFFKVGHAVRYGVDDLAAWLGQQRRRSTSEDSIGSASVVPALKRIQAGLPVDSDSD